MGPNLEGIWRRHVHQAGTFQLLESLYDGLDGDRRKRFMDLLKKSGGKKTGADVEKIHIVFFALGEFVTRTMIKKAYKEATEGK